MYSEKNNKICVLIPTKNRKHLLMRAVQSVLNQKLLPDEIIIVNDGSNDDTEIFLVEIAQAHPRIKVLNRKESGGVNVARHDGIAIAQSEWIACLDDDDEFFPDAIFNIKKEIVKLETECAVLFFNSVIKNNQGYTDGGFQFNGEDFYDLPYEELMVKHRIKGDCKPVFNKTIFDQGYAFPRTVNGAESYMFYLLARDGKKIRCFPSKTTLIYFDDSHQHLSYTAPRKNPQPLLDLHIKQLEEHRDFYKKNPKRLGEKYLTMAKLAVRAYNIRALVLYGIRFLLSKVRT